MKTLKSKLFVIIFFITNTIFGQLKEGKFYLSPPIQPSAEVHFKYAYSIASSIYVGQTFTFKATNVSLKRIRVKFDLIARTNCGNEVKVPFDILLDPKESKGYGDAFFDNEYIASVTKNDCAEGKPVTYTFKGKSLTGKNKINDVYIKNLVVNPLPDKLATSANANDTKNGTKPKKELTDDEKLNQAMMAQLEKDFEEDKKPKKVESYSSPSYKTNTTLSSTTKKENSSATTKKAEAETVYKSTPFFRKQGKEILFYKNSIKCFSNNKQDLLGNDISGEIYEGILAEDFSFSLLGTGEYVTAKKDTKMYFSYTLGPSNNGRMVQFVLKNDAFLPSTQAGISMNKKKVNYKSGSEISLGIYDVNNKECEFVIKSNEE